MNNQDNGYKTSTSNRPLKDESASDAQSGSRRSSFKKNVTNSNSLPKLTSSILNAKQTPSSTVKPAQKPKTPVKPSIDPLNANKTPLAIKQNSNSKVTPSKFLNSAAKPKVSNVASLQQKFETNPEERSTSDMSKFKK